MKRLKKFLLTTLALLSTLCLAAFTACDAESLLIDLGVISKPACAHVWGEWALIQEQSCTTDGKYERKCELCEETEETVFAKFGHEYEVDETLSVEPSCTVEGVKYERCSRCGDLLETNLGFGHVLEKFTGVKPTCTEGGYADWEQCTLPDCEYNTYTELEPLGHDLIEVEFKEPTCREGGTFAYIYCSRDNCPDETLNQDILETTNYIPAHWDVAEGEVCSNCFGLEYEISDDETSVTLTGLGEYTGSGLTVPVSYCGITVTEIAAGAFAESELVIVIVPNTVTKIGAGAFENCAELQIVELPDGITELEANTFKNCVNLKETVLPDGVHTIGASAFENCVKLQAVEFGAALENVGEKAFANCSLIEEFTVSEANEKFSSIDGNLYSKDGKTFYAYAPGKTNVRFVPAASVKTITEGAFIGAKFKYLIVPFLGNNEDEGDVLSYFFGGEVPSTLKTVTVTGGQIVDGAFENCEGLTEIALKGSLTTIADRTFYNCFGLLYVELGNNIVEIPEKAFNTCLRLTEVKLGEGIIRIGDYAFENCADLAKADLPSGLRSIGVSAFSNCDSLTYVNIPDSTTEVLDRAYFDCDSLKTVTIGTCLNTFGSFVFSSCDSLEGITVSEENEYFKSIGGNMYTKDGKTLIQYATGKMNTNFEVPVEVEEIGVGAFADGGDGLVSIAIGDSLKTIAENAFANCKNLENITVSEDNEYYQSIDGNLYSKDGKTLIRYGVGKTETEFEIPSTVETVAVGAFIGEADLERLTVYFVGESANVNKSAYLGHLFGAKSYKESADYLPESLKTVIVKDCEELAFNAFYGCELEELYLPFLGNVNGENSYLGYVFGAQTKENNGEFVPTSLKKVVLEKDAVVDAGAFMDCKSLEEVTLPTNLTAIGDNMFDGCLALTTVNMYEGLESIGAYAFRKCESLSAVYLPNSVKMIFASAFKGCKNLSALTLGNQLKEIYAYAFAECSALEEVTIPQSVKLIRGNAFKDTGLKKAFFEKVKGWTVGGTSLEVLEPVDTEPEAGSGATQTENYALTDVEKAAIFLKKTYVGKEWKNV